MEAENSAAAGKVIVNMDVPRIIIGLTEIGNLDIDDFDTNYNITKTITNLGVVEKTYTKTLQALMKKHIKVDDKGVFETENNSYVFLSKEDREKYLEEYESLVNAPVNAEVWKLKLSELRKIKGIKGTTMAKCHELIED